jgi:phenylalanyl-tRNA synthetase beta chain
LFEVGTVFKQGTGASSVEEWTSVAAVITGARRPPHWSEGAKVPDMDIWDLKYHFELAVRTASPAAQLRVAAQGLGWEAASPDGVVVGWAGPLEGDAPVWAASLFGFELRLEVGERTATRYRPLPTTPAVERDLALVLPPGVTAAAVDDVLRRRAGPLLDALAVFDEYRGPGIPAGYRSVAWHCSFRDPSRTLRENEVDTILAAALEALEAELGVRRRAG